MWILESNGDFLQGKRMWLKPGKKYLFGRVKKDGVQFAIDHKTVSRKHFVITVDEVQDEDVGQINTRSKVTITDENSKAGTNIDGKPLTGKSQEITNDTTSIQPGSSPDKLLINWVPCVLTFNLLKKEIKSGLLKTKQARVKELDIKAISEFLPGKTTHLVVQKRNTPKGLQALIDAKPLVTDSYVDALIYAATPTDLGEEENLCPLEIDFDDAWPDAVDHLPPPGKEPTTRPAEAYDPDEARANVFENFTFVFLDQSQHDTLLPPISLGHGKALMLEVIPGQTNVEEVVSFMRNTAGQRQFGKANKLKDKGGVIVIRPNDADEEVHSIVNQVSLKLDQRAIEQGEFLEAILANDAFVLRKSVPIESQQNGSGAMSPTPLPAASTHASQQDIPTTQRAASESFSQPAQSSAVDVDVPKTSKRARFIPPTKRVFENFDDDFDPDAIAAYDQAYDEAQPMSTPFDQTTQKQEYIHSDHESIKQEPPSSRKRARPSSPADVDEDMDDLLPGAAAMKRQKLEKEAEARRRGLSFESSTNGQVTAVREPRKPTKELDVRGAVRAQRAAEERAAKQEHDEIEGWEVHDDTAGPMNCVQVHGFELPVRKRTAETVNGVKSDRWDPKWNGRKNFKGFRRARDSLNGDDVDRRTNRIKVIVPVAEVKRKANGFGDEYWQKSPTEKERHAKEKENRKQSAAIASQSRAKNGGRMRESHVIHDSDDESSEDDDGRSHAEQDDHVSPRLERLQKEAAEVLHHGLDLDSPRRTRGDDIQRNQRSKRPATNTPNGRGTGTKRQKTLPVQMVHGNDSESDDSDDLKFKFGRGKKGKGKGKA